jgi:hypothetical protein
VRLPINAEEAFWAPGAGVTVPPLLLLLLPVCERQFPKSLAKIYSVLLKFQRDLNRFIFIFYF